MATYIKTVDPNGGADYTSISAWEAGEQSLYTSGDIAIADCRRTGATKDTTPVTVDGWPAGVVPKIIVNPVYRHEGRWAEQRVSDGNYVYICEGGGSANVIAVNVQDAVVDGLAAVALQSPYGYRSIFRSGIATGIRFENIFGRCASTTTNTHGFSAEISGTTLINAIFWASVASAGTGVRFPYTSCHCYNVTSFGFNRGFEVGWGAADVVNCYGGGTTVASYQTSQLHANTNNNVSSDSTAPGTTRATGKTAYSDYFVDPANGDFHLKNTSDNLWGISGVDLSGVFTADIDGQTRSVPWDIGADQYVAAGGTPGTATPAGVSSTASAGTATAKGRGKATPAGVAASSSVGTVTAKARGSSAPAGVSSTAATGTATATGKGKAAPAGVYATAAVGEATASHVGGNTAYPAGVSASAAVGTATGKGKAAIAPAGVSAVSMVGAAIGSGKAAATITGISAATGVGAVSGSGRAIALPGGFVVVTAAGTAISTGRARITVAGVAAAAAVGTATAGHRGAIPMEFTATVVDLSPVAIVTIPVLFRASVRDTSPVCRVEV